MDKVKWQVRGFIISFIIVLSIILALALTSCEPTDYSSEECCWLCAISTTYYYECNPYEVTLLERYEYCDMSDSAKVAWEDKYTNGGFTADSIKYIRIAKCRK